MKWWVILIEMLVFAGIFTALVFINYGGNNKYSIGSIHNYPPDIQEEYFKTHERVDTSYRSKNVLLTKGCVRYTRFYPDPVWLCLAGGGQDL